MPTRPMAIHCTSRRRGANAAMKKLAATNPTMTRPVCRPNTNSEAPRMRSVNGRTSTFSMPMKVAART